MQIIVKPSMRVLEIEDTFEPVLRSLAKKGCITLEENDEGQLVAEITEFGEQVYSVNLLMQAEKVINTDN